MDDVEPENQRDFQPRLLHRDLLIAVRVLAAHVEKGADLSVGDHLFIAAATCAGPGGHSAGILAHLAELFVQRHLPRQR